MKFELEVYFSDVDDCFLGSVKEAEGALETKYWVFSLTEDIAWKTLFAEVEHLRLMKKK